MKIKLSLSKYLAILIPILTIFYATSEYCGLIDKLTNREKAIEGLNRLTSATGYPQGLIFNDDQDKVIFNALEKRISKNTYSTRIKTYLSNGDKPTLIAEIGSPTEIQGVPSFLAIEEKRYYSENQPIFYAFGVTRNNINLGMSGRYKFDKACTLGELRKWIDNEKEFRRFFVGVVLINILAIAIIMFRREPSKPTIKNKTSHHRT